MYSLWQNMYKNTMNWINCWIQNLSWHSSSSLVHHTSPFSLSDLGFSIQWPLYVASVVIVNINSVVHYSTILQESHYLIWFDLTHYIVGLPLFLSASQLETRMIVTDMVGGLCMSNLKVLKCCQNIALMLMCFCFWKIHWQRPSSPATTPLLQTRPMDHPLDSPCYFTQLQL